MRVGSTTDKCTPDSMSLARSDGIFFTYSSVHCVDCVHY